MPIGVPGGSGGSGDAGSGGGGGDAGTPTSISTETESVVESIATEEESVVESIATVEESVVESIAVVEESVVESIAVVEESVVESIATATESVTKISFSEDSAVIDITVVNQAVDTGIAVPANTKTILFNYGAATDTATAGRDLLWIALPIEEWERLVEVAAGDTPTQENARFTRTWMDPDITSAGGTGARQIWIGRGANGNMFVWSDNVGWDIHPFRARFEIHVQVDVVTGVTPTAKDAVTSVTPTAKDVVTSVTPTAKDAVTSVTPTARDAITSVTPTERDAVTVVTIDGGGGLSEIPILAPASVPTRENWIAGAAQWVGEYLAPIKRLLAGGHTAGGSFAPIGQDGYERFATAASYAAMQSPPTEEYTYFWLWAVGQDVIVGDLSVRDVSGVLTYHRCIRAHTTVAGNVTDGPPNVASTGWEAYDRVEVGNRANFLGYWRDNADIPGIGLAPIGKWAAFTEAGYLRLEIFQASPSRWVSYIPPGHGLTHGEFFPNNTVALRDVQSFVSNQQQYFSIARQLRILRSWTPPQASHEVFQPVVSDRGPVSMVAFWGEGQNEEVGGAILREITSGSNYRWEFDQGEPNDLIFGPDPGVRAVNASFAANADLLGIGVNKEVLADRRVLQFPPGRYLVDAFMSTRQSTDSSLIGAAYEILPGVDDHLVQVGSGYSSSGTNDALNLANGTGNIGQVIDIPVFTFTVPDGETGQLTFITTGLQTGAAGETNAHQRDSAFRVFVTKVA